MYMYINRVTSSVVVNMTINNMVSGILLSPDIKPMIIDKNME